MYVYIKSEPNLWTVGFYRYCPVRGADKFESESDHSSPEDAAARVHYLNGGNQSVLPTSGSPAHLRNRG